MTYIIVKEKQSLELIARRLRRLCEKNGLFKKINFYASHKKPSEIRKLAKELGKKRAYRRMLRDNPPIARARQHTQRQH